MDNNTSWTEVIISVPTQFIGQTGDIATMTVPYGFYIEDYSDLEQGAHEIAHIDLIDEELLSKDRDHALVHLYISPEENPAEAIDFMRTRLNEQQIPFDISINHVKTEDWANNWKQYFKPLPIGEKLLIQPTWIAPDDSYSDRHMLHIDPGMAFGTGGHNTTKLCLEAIEKYLNKGDSMLDIGCGSGILSIASLLLGANSAKGVDIDALAVKTAVENGRINGFAEPEYVIYHGDLVDKIEGKFDVIAANIVADIIIRLCKTVKQFMHQNSRFIVSGIVDVRQDDVLAAFDENGLDVESSFEDGGWLCYVLKMRK